MAMATVTFDHVWKRFGEFAAVKDLQLEIQDAEFMVLVGPSGCGKTTSLRMIAGLEEVTEGNLKIGDRVVNDIAPKDRDIAMVFQSYALYPHMSIYDNMAFGLKLRKVPKAEIDQRVKEAARILNLENLQKKPRELSGGQRQRVAIARALALEPDIVVLDEAVSALDVIVQAQILDLLAELQNRLGLTYLFISHDLAVVRLVSDEVHVMRAGRIVESGPPEQIFDAPQDGYTRELLAAIPGAAR